MTIKEWNWEKMPMCFILQPTVKKKSKLHFSFNSPSSPKNNQKYCFITSILNMWNSFNFKFLQNLYTYTAPTALLSLVSLTVSWHKQCYRVCLTHTLLPSSHRPHSVKFVMVLAQQIWPVQSHCNQFSNQQGKTNPHANKAPDLF